MAYSLPQSLAREYYGMVIIETSIFTRQVQALLADEEYRELQVALVNRPQLGSVIPCFWQNKVRPPGKGMAV